jgi:hypothetical protein
MNEAQVLFGSVLVTSGYLLYRVLEAGLLGSLSARYFEWAGRTNEQKKLEFALTAEKATLHFKAPTIETDAKVKFDEQVDKVPMDDATGEAIISGPLYVSWLNETRKALIERACESIVTFRTVDAYFRDTFCKMSQGLASTRAWKEAEQARANCELEFQEIAEWALKLKPGWDQRILMECSKVVDERQRRQMEQQRRDDVKLQQEAMQRQQERINAKIAASERKYGSSGEPSLESSSEAPIAQETDATKIEELAKAAQEELLSEEEKKGSAKRKTNTKRG